MDLEDSGIGPCQPALLATLGSSTTEVCVEPTVLGQRIGSAGTAHRKRRETLTTMFASCTTHAGIEVARHHSLIAVLALASCATTRADRNPPSGDLTIALSAGWIEDSPAAVILITNRSSASICVRAEALRNPWSNEIRLRLRDARGRRVGLYPAHGSSEPQLEEILRLEPGMTTRGQLYLERFRRIGQSHPVPVGWRIQAQVPYGNCQPIEGYCGGRFGLCPDAWSSRTTSTWQPLSITARE